MLRYEKKAYKNGAKIIAGIDEAGRGPLAGPVVAAAAILPQKFNTRRSPIRSNSPRQQREEIYAELTANPEFPLGRRRLRCRRHRPLQHPPRDLARHAAGAGQPERPSRPRPGRWPARAADGGEQTAIVKGDAKSFSIAAASVIAKVTRDRMMLKIHEQFPNTILPGTKATARPNTLPRSGNTARRPCIADLRPVRQAIEPVQAEFARVICFSVGSKQKERSSHAAADPGRTRRKSRRPIPPRRGYKFSLRNFRSGKAEVDIVARDKDWLVFVEVKTRETEEFGAPSEAVNATNNATLARRRSITSAYSAIPGFISASTSSKSSCASGSGSPTTSASSKTPST